MQKTAARRLSFTGACTRNSGVDASTEYSMQKTIVGTSPLPTYRGGTTCPEDEEVTPSLSRAQKQRRVREAWSCPPSETAMSKQNQLQSASDEGECQHSIPRGGSSSRPSIIPTSLLTLPRAVVVAAMRQKKALTDGGLKARDAQKSIRSWLEQRQLLKQREELLSSSVLSRGLLNDADAAAPLQQTLDEAHQWHHERRRHAADIAGELRRTRDLTNTFRDLVTRVMPGTAYLEELKQVMQAAEAQLLTARRRHEEALQFLAAEECSLDEQLDSCVQRMKLWESEDQVSTKSVAMLRPRLEASRCDSAVLRPAGSTVDDDSSRRRTLFLSGWNTASAICLSEGCASIEAQASLRRYGPCLAFSPVIVSPLLLNVAQPL